MWRRILPPSLHIPFHPLLHSVAARPCYASTFIVTKYVPASSLTAQKVSSACLVVFRTQGCIYLIGKSLPRQSLVRLEGETKLSLICLGDVLGKLDVELDDQLASSWRLLVYPINLGNAI